MKYEITNWDEYYDRLTSQKLELHSSQTEFDYKVLDWLTGLALENSAPYVNLSDLKNFDELTEKYSNCKEYKEQMQTNERGHSIEQRLNAAIRYIRRKAREKSLNQL